MSAKCLAIALALGLGCAAATQTFAYQIFVTSGLTFPPGLGVPWVRLDLLVFYPPWNIGLWWSRWGSSALKAFLLPGMLGLVVTGFALYRGWPRAPKEREAHWATRRELQEAECLPRWRLVWQGGRPHLRTMGQTGVILGWVGWQCLKYWGDGHLLIDAGSGTGKTTM